MKLIKSKCIVCNKNSQERGMFCIKCFNKDIFIKIKAFKKSKEFEYGYYKARLFGKLPTKEERERT